ncbi:hypothetical protein KOW79_006045 [Hemibagrus wyckioides]|uniref:Myb/SANT-like DNA-binding domain-containing protein n=1 Tax=Hemibagrus wyckioides TaxID=337641 RepID=A0A9D3SSF9_9TELE|nr:hypothetical protein KOW79_006045 [Hemibagrus wyckioides]
MARERAAFFSPFEQEIILKTFEEYKAIITAKCNTAAAAKARVEAWQKIADRLNHANPNNIKRTWQQVKIKYKNIVQSNRKRKQKFGEGLATSGFSPAEEVALWQIRGRPVIDGTLLGLSSEQTGVGVGRPVATEPESSAALIQTVPTILDCAEEPAEHSDSEHDEKNIVVCSHPEEGTEAYTSQEDPGPSGPADGDGERDEDVTALYKRYLRQEIAYRQLKMKKLEKEIQLLDKQLDLSEEEMKEAGSFFVSRLYSGIISIPGPNLDLASLPDFRLSELALSLEGDVKELQPSQHSSKNKLPGFLMDAQWKTLALE